ncbi:MAG: cysteine synthase family protein [Acidobacteriota bacterium]
MARTGTEIAPDRTTLRKLRVFDRLSDAVGWTPMVRLGPTVAEHPQTVYAKLEYMNPMGSSKDRLARFLVDEALENGRLAAGGTVIEASSGNTAMGLAMMAAQEGLHFRAVVRRQTSPEKLDCLRALGVELELVDGELPAEDEASYNRRAESLVEEIDGAYFPDQHNNRLNNQAHYRSTGPEIWEQMEGRIDAVIAGIGTGGTLSGVARYLKEQDPAIRIVAVDIEGSVFTEFFETGQHGAPGPYLVEGLGDEEIIGCPEFELFDDMVQSPNREALLGARELARREAMFVGGSSGAALWGVRQILPTLPAGARVVTIFPDSGSRYLSTIYSDEWMQTKGLL